MSAQVADNLGMTPTEAQEIILRACAEGLISDRLLLVLLRENSHHETHDSAAQEG